MWSHYTSNHTGVCIEYEILGDNYTPSKNNEIPLSVHYKEERTIISTADMDEYRSAHQGNLSRPPMKTFNALLFEKSKAWSYESEWRVYSVENAEPGYVKFPRLKPTALIWGVNAKSFDISETRNFLPTTIPFFQVGLSDHTYELQKHRI